MVKPSASETVRVVLSTTVGKLAVAGLAGAVLWYVVRRPGVSK